MDVYVRLSARSAEEAFRSARGIGGGAGFALDADLVTGLGAALVGALDELGPVMVVAAVSGAPEVVGTTAARLARLGAVWVTVAAAAGAEATRAAVDAVAGTGCGIVVHTLGVGLDEAAVGTLTGSTRGRMVSRLAASAAGAGAAAVICSVPDLGVVAQVAPDLVRIVDAGGDPDEWREASRRGAGVLVLPDPAALRGFRAASDAPGDPRGHGRRR